MNPVLTVAYNCLELTERSIESVRYQDVPTRIVVVDNGSTDGTAMTLSRKYPDIEILSEQDNRGVSYAWNRGLKHVFSDFEHCLVINNDVELPPWFYREMLGPNLPFVTGVAVDYLPVQLPPSCPLTPHPDFSAFLIRKSCWQAVGEFDETMVSYCSDCDYHIRAHRKGVPLMKANVPYFHINSQTMKRSSPEIRRAIESQANRDRDVFRSKYGCLPGTPDYDSIFEEAHAQAQTE